MAEDIRPVCKCHGEPMLQNGKPRIGRTKREYVCGVKRRASVRRRHWENGDREQRIARYEARKDAGLCPRCGADDPINVVCWKCLNEAETRDALRI